MPRYTYCCEECDIIIHRAHSIKEKLTDCEECGMEGVLKRIPSMPFVFSDKKQTGNLVKQYIEDVKSDLKEEKEELSNQVYSDD